MRLSRSITVTAVAAILSGAAAASAPADDRGAVAAAAAATALREYEGTVVSVDRGSRSFRLRDVERGTVRIRVNSRTRFERLNGLGSLRRGMTNIEAVVRRSRGAWVALEVERSGGGGEHGGRRGGRDDDRSGRDDDRGRGRGSDDRSRVGHD